MAVTVETALRSVSAYPIPTSVVEMACLRRGLTSSSVLTQQDTQSEAYNLACADLCKWLADAPAVSQGGQSYTISDEQRNSLRQQANALYAKYDADTATVFGYKGSRL